jgi:aspartate aminotransferase-like enzyme
VVFAPHVETASGIMLPDDYLRTVADAAHEVGALFVLDCVASGAMWVDMEKTGVDVLISAPQRAGAARPAAPWSCSRARPRGHRAHAKLQLLLRPEEVDADCRGYEKGQHAYHTTMPTDALLRLRDVMLETREYGFAKVREEQMELGARCASCCSRAAFPAWRPRATRPRRGRQLHHRPGNPERPRLPQGGPADRLGRAAAMR